ncbi:hypothetical protein HDU99_000610, partial [Rhizoclosmatium hyalinum]
MFLPITVSVLISALLPVLASPIDCSEVVLNVPARVSFSPTATLPNSRTAITDNFGTEPFSNTAIPTLKPQVPTVNHSISLTSLSTYGPYNAKTVASLAKLAPISLAELNSTQTASAFKVFDYVDMSQMVSFQGAELAQS